MLKNYLKIALRNLWKHKTFSFINIIGMAIAFAVAVPLVMTAFHELSYDGFHQNKASIHQLYIEKQHTDRVENNTFLPAPLTPALKAEYPDIRYISRYGSSGKALVRYGNQEIVQSTHWVDEDFLRMFSFPLIKGSNTTALGNLNATVLTDQSAKALFGKEDPMGKTVQVNLGGEWKSLMVTGIAKDIPSNSSLNFGMLARFENSPEYYTNKDSWDHSTHEVFVQLKEQSGRSLFETKLIPFVHKYYQPTIDQIKKDGAAPGKNGEYMQLRTIPLTDLHFTPTSIASAANRFYPYLLLLIAGFILFIASVNFVNLSLGRSFTRIREVGIRKVMGASRRQILSQFWGEALIICLVAFLAGILLAKWIIPQYKLLFRQSLSPGILSSPAFIISIVAGFMMVSLLAGGYPALLLSKLNIVQTVKGKLGVNSKHRVRNGLITVQFVLSGLLIICTSIVWQQLNYMRQKPLGYNKSQVISIPIDGNIKPERALAMMRTQLSNKPDILSVTGTDMNLGMGRDGSSTSSRITFTHKGKTVQTNWLRVDYDYLKTLDISLLKGRDFSTAFGADSTVVLINETMAKALGEKNPVDSMLGLDGTNLRIAGVVKDFNFRSLHKNIEPLTMAIRNDWPMTYLFVKVAPGNLVSSMTTVTNTWKSINPQAKAEPSFLDENSDKQYRKEERLTKIFVSAAILAIVISCMGLFAIVVLVVSQRTKEIGIRKVLGASVFGITAMIAREFLKLVALALLIATPVSWWLMHKWLEDFAYRVKVSPFIFVAVGVIAILIALVTICLQAVRAARVNPVRSLRTE